MQPAGHKVERWKTVLYCFCIVDHNQAKHEIFAYRIDSITDSLDWVRVQALSKLFPGLDPDRAVRCS